VKVKVTFMSARIHRPL